jgi:hypothetical protein
LLLQDNTTTSICLFPTFYDPIKTPKLTFNKFRHEQNNI